MKVKFKVQEQVLTCSNNDFIMTLQVHIQDQSGNSPRILFDPKDVFKFVELDFFPTILNLDPNPARYQRFLNLFLYQGCSVVLDSKMFINATGLKHFFSSLVSHRVFENSLANIIDWKCAKFLNWVLNFDFNLSIQKAVNIPTDSSCINCKKSGLNLNHIKNGFDANLGNIEKWKSKIESKEDQEKYNSEYLEYLGCLFKVAAKEIRKIIALDIKLSQIRSLDTPLATYNPSEDWLSTCPIIKLFINECFTEQQSDLCKIVFRNMIFIGNQRKNYYLKPQSAYFVSCILKYLHDKQKILDFLSNICIAVGDDPVNRLEKRQIDQFNSVFWNINNSCNVMACMDNNQADFGSKNYNPLHDEHHVDCLNVLQVIKPGGNPVLHKNSKKISELSDSFSDSNHAEKKARNVFNKSFISYLIKSNEILPKDKLSIPQVNDIIPVNGSEISNSLLTNTVLKLNKENGNHLRNRLLDEPKHIPFQVCDPEDQTISWDNKQGSKTSLRYLKLGKSTDTHVFLDCLDFLYKTFKTEGRPKIFLTLDQALHFKFKNLVTLQQMPSEFIDFFIVVLDPFHHHWCLLKCLFSAYESAGLKDLMGILAIDDNKWPNLLGESKNVHKAQGLLEVLATALGIFFINFMKERLSAEMKVKLVSFSSSAKLDWFNRELPKFLDEISAKDKTLSIYVQLYRFSLLVIQCWESQRIANFDMYIDSIKQTLPFLFAFNRFNYQQSTLEFISDISLLGEYYIEILKSGIMFENMAATPGKHVSCGYVLEIYNKIIKQITPNIDGSGSGWLRNLPRLAFIRQILQNASKSLLFTDVEKDPVKSKIPNIDQIAKLRWLFEKRNIFNIEEDHAITERDAVHIISGQTIDDKFLNCKFLGAKSMQDFISKILEYNPLGSFEFIRKKLAIKKIVPFEIKRRTVSKSKNPLSKAEKQTLLANLPDEEIPRSSCSMLSPNNGNSPYMESKKSESGKFILNRYAKDISIEMEEFDLVVVDFMALIFCKPPSYIYASKQPLESFCAWLVSTMIAPSLLQSSTLVLCIDRKALDVDFPLKVETHKKRNAKATGNKEFTHLLSKLLDTDLKIVTDFYIPPYSWMSTDRNVRFQLIFRAFEEIFDNPEKYPFHSQNFSLYVDGFANNGEDLYSKILICVNGSYSIKSSTFSVCLPEADQSIFYIIKQLPYKRCLIKYKDNDILLSSLLQSEELCNSNQKIFLQNIGFISKIYDINGICEMIIKDESLSHFKHPVQSLVFAFLVTGNNDYTGKIWGVNPELAFKSLVKTNEDLACLVNEESFETSKFAADHLFTLISSKIKYSISQSTFLQFIQLLYIKKNTQIFKGLVQTNLPKNVKKWVKNDLISAFESLNISTKGEDGKELLVPALRDKLSSHLDLNLVDKKKIESLTSEGVNPLDLDYSVVQKQIWLHKNPREWCPTLEQIKNMYGRSVLTGLLFSCPVYFPVKCDLVKFGYCLDKDNLLHNLSPSSTKEKNPRNILTMVMKRLGNLQEESNKRKAKDRKNTKAKRSKGK